MDDFVAYPSRSRLASLTISAAVFVAGGLWMGGAFGPPPASSRFPPAVVFAIGWLSVLFFGLCGLAVLGRLFAHGVQVRIGSAGIRSVQWSDQTIPWSEIVDVTTWSHHGQNAIVLHLRNPRRFPGRGIPGLLARANRALTGGDVAVSLLGTNMRFEDALEAIAHFRPEAAQTRPLDKT